MNRRLVGVLVFALVVAGLFSFFLYSLLASHLQTTPKRAIATTKLIVAAHDLQVGALIHDFDLQEALWAAPVPKDSIAKLQDAIGRGVIAPIYQGEPIVDERLAPKGAGAGLAATIPIGKRAVALRVNDVVGLAGFVVPGMRVDVLAVGNVSESESQLNTLSKTILQNIEVLSAGQKIERNIAGKPETAQVVNLLVTPDQAEILNLASSEAKVQLVLRNPLDTKEEITHGTSVAGLFGLPEPVIRRAPQNPLPVIPRPKPIAAAPASAPEQTTVEVYSGVKKSDEKIDSPPEK